MNENDKIRNTEILKIKDYRELPSFEAQSLAVRNGGIVAFPTETVYGIAVSANCDETVEAVFRLKARDRGKPLTLHISDISVVDDFVAWDRMSEKDREIFWQLSERSWPGPLAVILPKKESVSDILTGGLSTISFRFPSHPVALAFIDACGGAVAGTSANLSGNFSCTSGKAVYEELGGRIDWIIDADNGILGLESTVISVAGGVRVLRQGAVGIPMLERVIGKFGIITGSVHMEIGNGESRSACAGENGIAKNHARSKVRFYHPEEVTKVFGFLVTDTKVSAVLLSDSVYYNISPILNDKKVKSRVRIMTKESLISKLYKVLRSLDSEETERIYLPIMEGDGVEAAISTLFE